MLLALLALIQDADADAILKKMEEKIAKAKTVSVAFSAELTIKAAPMGTLEGTLAASDANRLRVSAKGIVAKDVSYALVCDGKKEKISDASRDAVHDAPAARRDGAVTALARFGIGTGLLLSVVKGGLAPHEEDDAAAVKISGAKSAGTEEIGGRKAAVVTMTVTVTRKAGFIKEVPEEIAQTLWIDPETNLPLKRAISIKPAQGSERIVVETYSKWSLDASIDEATFKVR